MKRPLVLAVLSLALLSSRSSSVPPPHPAVTVAMAHPALWKVSDADTTIYLFGTIHLLPKELAWQSPKVDRAIRASQGLYLETVLGDPAQTGAIMTKLGISANLPPVTERVSAAKQALLAKAVTKAGIPLAVLDRFETWAVALTLASAGLKDLNLSTDYGAEAILTQRFKAEHKPVAGLETTAQQLGFFDALPEAAQRKFLDSVIEDDSTNAKQFEAMIKAWGSGNVNAIALTFDEELKLTPELADTLLHKRNGRWADWAAQRMAKPGTIFVAVGAGHLAGKGSVQDLLATKHFRITRVQ